MAISTSHIIVETHGAVQTIRLNRADKKNAITRDMYTAMTQALQSGEADEAIRVHAFFGQPGVFSAGNDVADFIAFATTGKMGTEVMAFLRALATLQKPVVSAVDGLAIGIGTTIHLHCDLTFATPGSLFKTPFVDLALVPEAASSLLVARTAGHQRAFGMLAKGDDFSSQAMLDAGLIYAVVGADEVEAVAMVAAHDLAAKPPAALKIAKQLLAGDRAQVLARIDEEATHFAAQLKSDEARAAFMAFMSRKK